MTNLAWGGVGTTKLSESPMRYRLLLWIVDEVVLRSAGEGEKHRGVTLGGE